MNKVRHFKEFVRVSLEPDEVDLRGLTVKETSLTVGLSVLMILVSVFHLVLCLWQFAVSLLLVGYDGIVWVLQKVLPKSSSSDDWPASSPGLGESEESTDA